MGRRGGPYIDFWEAIDCNQINICARRDIDETPRPHSHAPHLGRRDHCIQDPGNTTPPQVKSIHLYVSYCVNKKISLEPG